MHQTPPMDPSLQPPLGTPKSALDLPVSKIGLNAAKMIMKSTLLGSPSRLVKMGCSEQTAKAPLCRTNSAATLQN